ncbi:Uncharacterised protein [Vibrio cholerae]|nr:Uncharacterised protein [Vibrio cholerae]CSB05807.1 Uncharacterised protein [Vibrio cholerae]CSC76020.1 Uncharacterised protein [Vibrio cholerae]
MIYGPQFINTSSLSSAAAVPDNRESAHALPAKRVASFFIDVSSKLNVALLGVAKKNRMTSVILFRVFPNGRGFYFTFSLANNCEATTSTKETTSMTVASAFTSGEIPTFTIEYIFNGRIS